MLMWLIVAVMVVLVEGCMPKKNGNGAPIDPGTGQPMQPANYGPRPEMGKVSIGKELLQDPLGAIADPKGTYETIKENRARNKRVDYESTHNLYGRQANPRGNFKNNNDTRGAR